MRLTREFFTRNTVLVARELLGKTLVYKGENQIYKGKIVEVEAYINENDDAAHFSKGLTNRTRVVGEEGGHIYMYTIYGMYECFNVIAEKKGVHGGVLIRAIEPIEGIEKMYQNRFKKPFHNPPKRELINISNGPAKFVMAYGINKADFYGRDLVKDPEIWIEDNIKIPQEQIVSSPRINVDYAKAKDYLLRFNIKDNPYVSIRTKINKK